MTTTTMVRAWAVTRSDGVTLGFTEHDRKLAFEGIIFAPDAGLSARMLVTGSGLAVDNSEVLGALSGEAISEADIEAGRYDGAEVRLWIVDWRDPAMRRLRFRGTLGEIRRADGGFHAELRGLTEQLNQPRGRVFQRGCSAVLGDAACGFDLARPGFSVELAAGDTDGQRFSFAGLDAHAAGWFAHGRLQMLDGAARGLEGIVKDDRLVNGRREVLLWTPLRAPVAPEDRLRLIAGCDRRAETCRNKFDNMINFQGFPHLPGEDWLLIGPRA